MPDDFIPLNQSTPVGGRWQGKRQGFPQKQHNHSHYGDGQRRGNNRRGNYSHSHYSSSGNNSNYSFNQDRNNIDAYLHPSMLQDPWASLRNSSEKSHPK